MYKYKLLVRVRGIVASNHSLAEHWEVGESAKKRIASRRKVLHLICADGAILSGHRPKLIQAWFKIESLLTLRMTGDPRLYDPITQAFKGGRGNKKPGQGRRHFAKPKGAAFPDKERQLMERVEEKLFLEQPISSRWLHREMLVLVRDGEYPPNSAIGAQAAAFKASRGWLYCFMRRHGLSFRRPTSERSHPVPLAVLGPMLAFSLTLRALRAASIQAVLDMNPHAVVDLVYGLYGLATTFNCDQVPLSAERRRVGWQCHHQQGRCPPRHQWWFEPIQ